MTKWTHNNAWPLAVTPRCTTVPCMLHTWTSTANHITLGAFELHIQIHKSNFHFLFHKSDIFCLFERMWRLSRAILSVWVQVISVSMSVVYFADRAQCKTVLPFTHTQTLDGDFCCHTVWSSGPIYIRPTNRQLWSRDIAMWQCRRGLRWGRQASLILVSAVVLLCPIIKPVHPFSFDSWYSLLLCASC
jgi:hypothetical protein